MGNVIFNVIRNQMINTLKENQTKGCLKFYKGLPTNVIEYLQRTNVARFNGLKKTTEKGKYVYTVFYTDLDKYSSFLKDTVEKLEKKGYITDSNDSVTVKFGKIHDKYRDELECNNFSSERDETGYAPAPWNTEGGYEKLSREDSVMFEMFTQWLGYDSYYEFSCVEHDEDSIDILYNHFLSEILVPEYKQGEEDNYDEQFTEEELIELIVGKDKEEALQ